MMSRVFLDHPRSVGESYFAHLLFALRFSVKLLAASGAALVHALIPCLFQKTASRMIAEMYQSTHNRGR